MSLLEAAPGAGGAGMLMMLVYIVIIFGAMYDDSQTDAATITVIATGLDEATTREPSVEGTRRQKEETKKNAFASAGFKMPSFQMPSSQAQPQSSAPRSSSVGNAAPKKDIQIPDFLKNRS